MTSAEAHFYGVLALLFGPLFLAGGWLASFTDVGALLILAGTVMLLAAPLLLRSAKAVPAALALIAVSWSWPFFLAAAS